MRKRTTRKSSAAAFLVSPPPPPSASTAATRSPSPAESPAVKFDFNLNGFGAGISSTIKKKSKTKGGTGASASKRIQTTGFSPSPQKSLKNVNTIADLKELASSNLDSIKHQTQRSHSEILKDAESSKCRLHKRYKIQTQECQRVMDEAEKEYTKMSGRINEGREAMKASYAEFIAQTQASASRICKTYIPELARSYEKRISELKSRSEMS